MSTRNGEEWPLSDHEYNVRQAESARITMTPRLGCTCDFCTAFARYAGLVQDGPRPGETQTEWVQVLQEAAQSVQRRLAMNINIRG